MSRARKGLPDKLQWLSRPAEWERPAWNRNDPEQTEGAADWWLSVGQSDWRGPSRRNDPFHLSPPRQSPRTVPPGCALPRPDLDRASPPPVLKKPEPLDDRARQLAIHGKGTKSL